MPLNRRKPDSRGLRTLALWVASILFLSCGADVAPKPNVLLIVVDTLRHDHIGAYGAARNTTPSIDAFAADAIRFERAYATAPWTQPSVASMLTGLYPSGHGLTGISRLSEKAETLSETLQAQGFATAAVVSHVYLSGRFGFRQGFEQFNVVAARPLHRAISSEKVTARAEQLLRSFAGDPRPFFLLVHYFDPHFVYRGHEAYAFAAERAGRLKGGEDIEVLQAMMSDASEEELAFVVDLYDEEVRYTDEGIGRLLDALRGLGLYQETLIVLVADHGEEFMDHGQLGHAKTLYEEVMRVPLIVRLPGGEGSGRVVDAPVSLASVTPTVLDVVSGDLIPAQYQTHSILPLMDAGAPGRLANDGEGSVFMEVDFEFGHRRGTMRRSHKRGLIVSSLKLIVDTESGAVELFDLAADPGEQRNVAEDRPNVVARMRAMLEQRREWVGRRGIESEDVEQTGEQLEELRALGYVQ